MRQRVRPPGGARGGYASENGVSIRALQEVERFRPGGEPDRKRS
jgi:hypothetical protein